MLHSDYLKHISTNLPSLLQDSESLKTFSKYSDEFIILTSLNFDPLINKLDLLYCPVKRAHHRDPVSMLRSLILMTLIKIRGITKWVNDTRTTSILAILSGFDIDDTPGVGTYYDFKKRIIDFPYSNIHKHQRRSFIVSQPIQRVPQKKEDDPHPKPNESKSQQLVNELLPIADLPRSQDFDLFLDDLLLILGVVPSLEKGLFDPNNIVISGDGSILATNSSAAGTPTCDCHSKGIYKCNHPHSFTSHTAKWCHKHTGGFTFGDRYYLLIVTQNQHDFPLSIIMPGGNESDHTLSIKAFDRFLKSIRENNISITIYAFSGDGHHDTNAHYQYFEEKNVIPVIPLSENAKKSKKNFPHLLEDRGISFNSKGTPLCPGGLPMKHLGFNKRKKAHVYNCPVKRGTHRNGKYVYVTHIDECPKKHECVPNTKMAPVIYIKPQNDRRLFPKISRDGKEFKRIRNLRSGTERLNSFFDSFHLDSTCRIVEYGLIRLILAAICCHAEIRYNEDLKRYSKMMLLRQIFNNIGIEVPPQFDDTS